MERTDTDVLIVGAGLAGLAAALGTSARRRVTLLCPSPPPSSTASALAQGGIAAAVGAEDHPALHAADTMRAGAGESWLPAAVLLCGEAPAAIAWLEAHGVRFDRDGDTWALHREAAHDRARVLHVGGDATGAGLTSALHRAALSAPNVEILSDLTAVSLMRDIARVSGVIAIARDGRPLALRANETVLATGGLGQLYLHTTNPPSACGDGLAMALRAGARLNALEFVQFHPTALACGTDPLPLVTEALRGAGAALVDERGQRIMQNVHQDGDLAPRDVVARTVWAHVSKGRRVWLDASGIMSADKSAFPQVRAICQIHCMDPERDPIPVVPAAHYHMGGIAVDMDGHASLPGLWACGEVACNGAHGANRLASNSLLEAVVFGRRLGAALSSRGWGRPSAARPDMMPGEAALQLDPEVWAALRHLTWMHAGIVRNARGLLFGLAELAALYRKTAEDHILLRGRLLVAEALLTAAWLRKESCGAHLRADDSADASEARCAGQPDPLNAQVRRQPRPPASAADRMTWRPLA
ncbi:MAG: L-aspartate oxidase [Gammaproteobacteria bacterium]|nr:L-aspartate oxidase [Gammaproteobacteria bacterium]